MKSEERIYTYNNETINMIMEAHKQSNTPFHGGAAVFIRGYIYTNDKGLAEYAVEYLPVGEAFREFIHLLNEAGITEFILMDESTALMEILNELMALGWVICGGFKIQGRWDTRHGLRIKKMA